MADENPIREEALRTPEAHLWLIDFLSGGDDARVADGFERWLATPDVHPYGCSCRTHRFRDPEPRLPGDHREASRREGERLAQTVIRYRDRHDHG